MTRINQPLSLNPSERDCGRGGKRKKEKKKKKNRQFDKVGGRAGGLQGENRSLSNGAAKTREDTLCARLVAARVGGVDFRD